MSTPAVGHSGASARRSDIERVMTLAGQAFTRNGAVYSIGLASVLPFALLSLAVTTRYLGLSDYGRLGILFTIASLLTIFSGMAVVQGVMILVYGAADDEGDGDGDAMGDDGGAPLDVDPSRIAASAAEKRRLLGSGMLLILVSSTVWCGAAALLAPLIAAVLLDSTSWTPAVLLMTVSAWTGSVWRLAHQVWRVERRPVVWSLFQALRPLIVVGATIAALAAGLRVEGVLIATAGGTAVAILISIACSWRYFVFRPQRADARRIIDAGKSMVPIIVARVIQSNVSVLLLGVIAPAASVGLFYAASKIAMIPSFFASGFQLAWIPLTHSAIGAAGVQLRGRSGYNARVLTLLVLILVGLTILISLGSTAAIRIAAPEFGDAADLIPALAVAAATYDVFHGYYRASSFRNRRWWYTLLLFIWLFPYAGALWLGNALEPTYAVSASQIVASAFVLACMVRLDRRGVDPLPVPWVRIGCVVAIAAACVAAVRLGGGSWQARLGLGLVVLGAFPLVLRATGLISRADVAKIIAILSALLPMRRRRLREGLERMRPVERRALELVVWRGLSQEDAAAEAQVGPDLVGARVVRALRTLMGSEEPATPADAAIARYALSQDGAVEQDLMTAALGRMGVSLVELHELDETMRWVRRSRRRGLRLLRARGGARPEAARPALVSPPGLGR